MTTTHPAAAGSPAPAAPPAGSTSDLSDHASPADLAGRKAFGPRVRRLHGRIGAAHHQAEGMAFSRALHDAIEHLDLSEAEESELLEEAVVAFQDTQRLLAELGALASA